MSPLAFVVRKARTEPLTHYSVQTSGRRYHWTKYAVSITAGKQLAINISYQLVDAIACSQPIVNGCQPSPLSVEELGRGDHPEDGSPAKYIHSR